MSECFKETPTQPTKKTEAISESNQRPGRKEVQKGVRKKQRQKKNSKV